MLEKKIYPKDNFFDKLDRIALAVTFDEVLVQPGYSKVLPKDVDVNSRFSRNIPVKQPLISSPMDTVTEYPMAIAMALSGGLGIIHGGLTLEQQIHNLERTKFFLQGGFIPKPKCARPDETLEELENRRQVKEYDFHSFPVIDNDRRLIGLVTRHDFKYCRNQKCRLAEFMSTELITRKINITIREAYDVMSINKKSVLPIVDDDNRIAGLYVWQDVDRTITGNKQGFNIDSEGRLRVGVAVGVGEEAIIRTEQLINKGVDVIVIDSAHGHSKKVIDTLKEIKRNFSVDVVAGNVSKGEAAKCLVDAGADGIKVGMGPGSICTTRVVAGIGSQQITAIYNCEHAIRGSGVPIIADGGIKNSGDITKAIGAGADCVMIGNLFAGTDEAPGKVKLGDDGLPYKLYRGMGSLGAMEDREVSRVRYGQPSSEKGKLVPEGMEGKVPYKGPVGEIFFQLIGGLRAGMGYAGAENITEFQEKADFERNTDVGLRESHPHDITFLKMPPNYNMGAGKTGL